MRKDIAETSLNTTTAEGTIVSHLLHPTDHFEHPRDVLAAAHLSQLEKRAILAAWASDQYAVESIPALRHYPGSAEAVSLVEVLAALRSLDGEACDEWKTSLAKGRTGRRFDLRCLMPLRRRVRKSVARS